MKINYVARTIEMTKWASVRAEHFDCEDRQMLAAAQNAHPDFQVVVEDIPFPNMKTGKGATYDFMECYILLVTSIGIEGISRQMEEFRSMRRRGCSYFAIKNWFVKEFRFDTL